MPWYIDEDDDDDDDEGEEEVILWGEGEDEAPPAAAVMVAADIPTPPSSLNSCSSRSFTSVRRCTLVCTRLTSAASRLQACL